MVPTAAQLVIEGIPSHVACWSAASIPGFIPAVLERWQRDCNELPARFAMVICPQVEIHAMGGLPDHVRELTNPRLRFLHFTGCHRPFVVLLYSDGDADQWRAKVQRQLSWSEGYQAESTAGMIRLNFIEAIEELDGDRIQAT